jgi:hypothetical protein
MNIVGPLAGRETLNAGPAPQAKIYARKAVAMAEEAIRSDPTNKRARYDLSFGYTNMGDAVSATHPDFGAWYRKSIEFTKQLGARTEARSELAGRNETLASVCI